MTTEEKRVQGKPDPNGLGFDRCHYDPCLYSKRTGKDNMEIVSMTGYVDDFQVYNDSTATCRAEREQTVARLEHRFQITFNEVNKRDEYLLGTNTTRLNQHASHLNMSTYIASCCKRYLKKALADYPARHSHLPVDPKPFMDDYERCEQLHEVTKGDLYGDYNSIVGALQYAVRRRPDISHSVNICARCLTFPTQAMYDHAVGILVYLGRTPELGLTYSKYCENGQLTAYADSDWNVKRSTTGVVIMFGGAAIGYISRRQHCIALSSTEAELMALAAAALELLFFKGVLESLGETFDGPIDVHTDSQGSFDLCHRNSPGNNTRHVDRKMYKMRELRGSEVVLLHKIDGTANPADMFTKSLTRQPFELHRKAVMNLGSRKYSTGERDDPTK